MSGFIKLWRDNEDVDAMFSKGYHNEFILLTIIALRARRTQSKVADLQIGQALIGDYENYGLTEKKYRTAKKNLEKWGLVAFKGTSKGTIATLIESSIYDINIELAGEQKGEQRASEGRAEGEQGATNKNVKNERNKSKGGSGSQFDIISFDLPGWIDRETFLDFMEERKRLKAVNSERAVKGLITKLSELSGCNPVSAKRIIEESIINSWKGLFPLKQEVKPQPVYTPPRLKEF